MQLNPTIGSELEAADQLKVQLEMVYGIDLKRIIEFSELNSWDWKGVDKQNALAAAVKDNMLRPIRNTRGTLPREQTTILTG